MSESDFELVQDITDLIDDAYYYADLYCDWTEAEDEDGTVTETACLGSEVIYQKVSNNIEGELHSFTVTCDYESDTGDSVNGSWSYSAEYEDYAEYLAGTADCCNAYVTETYGLSAVLNEEAYTLDLTFSYTETWSEDGYSIIYTSSTLKLNGTSLQGYEAYMNEEV